MAMTEPEAEEAGMWIGSELGCSFACVCGWRSGIFPKPADVRWALAAHVRTDHNGPSSDTPENTPQGQ